MLFRTAGGCEYRPSLPLSNSANQNDKHLLIVLTFYHMCVPYNSWSLPEARDCLEEAGFRSIHFWIREMPNVKDMRNTKGFGNTRDDKYEEASSFQQQDAWNAYIVAVA